MNTNLLKQKILDLAIRGKLTQQLKSDGTAADLLTQISDERRKTRDERKGTRSKKSGVILSEAQSAKSKDLGQIIPLDKSEAPFEIPVNWEWVCIDSIASLITDGEHLTPRRVESFEGYYLLSARNIQDNEILLNNVDYVDEDEYNRIAKRCNPRKNDVLISCSGSIGRVTVVRDDNKYVMVRSAAMIRPVFVHSCYLMYVLQSNCLQSQIQNYSKQTAQANLFQAAIRALQFPLPPLAEQQRIVAKIEEAFAEIDAIEKNKELLKTHIKQTRQKILDLAIHGKLVPQNKSDEPASVLLERITRDNPHYEKLTDVPFEIPASWEWVKYAELVTNISVKNFQVKSSEIQPIGTFPVVSQGQSNIDGFVDDPKKVVHLRFPIVLFGDHTKIVKYIDFDFVVGADGTKVLEAKSAINPKYLYFMTLNIVEKIEDRGYGRHFALLSNSLCPLPPLAEQKRIVDRIEEIFASLDEISLHLV